MATNGKDSDSEKGSVQHPSVEVEEAQFEKGLEAQGIHVPKSGFIHKVCTFRHGHSSRSYFITLIITLLLAMVYRALHRPIRSRGSRD
jgi:hypothetical protein